MPSLFRCSNMDSTVLGLTPLGCGWYGAVALSLEVGSARGMMHDVILLGWVCINTREVPLSFGCQQFPSSVHLERPAPTHRYADLSVVAVCFGVFVWSSSWARSSFLVRRSFYCWHQNVFMLEDALLSSTLECFLLDLHLTPVIMNCDTTT